MKTLALGLLFALASTLSPSAQDADMEAKYKAKLEESFVSNIHWVQSLAEAQKQAEDRHTLIFGYFSRSYAP